MIVWLFGWMAGWLFEECLFLNIVFQSGFFESVVVHETGPS